MPLLEPTPYRVQSRARSLDGRGCPLATPLTALELRFLCTEHITRGRWDAPALVLAEAAGIFAFVNLYIEAIDPT